jgi:hypothetical protein
MGTRDRQRDVRYEVRDGYLVRTVTFSTGGTYWHRCSMQVYDAVADAIGAMPEQGEGVTLGSLAKELDLPFTQVNIALEFMKERGVVVTRSRRIYPASNFAYSDAMIEFHALKEKEGAAG